MHWLYTLEDFNGRLILITLVQIPAEVEEIKGLSHHILRKMYNGHPNATITIASKPYDIDIKNPSLGAMPIIPGKYTEENSLTPQPVNEIGIMAAKVIKGTSVLNLTQAKPKCDHDENKGGRNNDD